MVRVTTPAPLPGAPPAPPRPLLSPWVYPTTSAEALRYEVFKDLHSKGYTLTSGAKFGGDYLAYPGDPLLYHAQFTVRCVAHSSPQHPLALAGATRMAHAARKHVVLASVEPRGTNEEGGSGGGGGGGCVVRYVTFAPDIQQSTNRDRAPGGGKAKKPRVNGGGNGAAAATGGAAAPAAVAHGVRGAGARGAPAAGGGAGQTAGGDAGVANPEAAATPDKARPEPALCILPFSP